MDPFDFSSNFTSLALIHIHSILNECVLCCYSTDKQPHSRRATQCGAEAEVRVLVFRARQSALGVTEMPQTRLSEIGGELYFQRKQLKAEVKGENSGRQSHRNKRAAGSKPEASPLLF